MQKPQEPWTNTSIYNDMYVCISIYMYQLVGELNSGELVTGVFAGAAAAEHTYAPESRRLCWLRRRRRRQRLELVVVFHCIYGERERERDERFEKGRREEKRTERVIKLWFEMVRRKTEV